MDSPPTSSESEPDWRAMAAALELKIAAIKGDLGDLLILLDEGADPNVLDEGGETPLIHAAYAGHAEVVLLLLERGANPNVASDGDTALTHALFKDHLETAGILLKHGANPNHTRPIGGVGTAGETPLITAAQDQNCAAMRLLLSSNANPNLQVGENRDGKFALAEARNLAEMEILLDHGANPNLFEMPDKLTCIHLSAVAGKSAEVQLLLSHGADPEHKSASGMDALQFAVHGEAGAESALPAFIEAVKGWHPLQIATGCRLHEAIRSALRLGKYDPSDCTLARLTATSAAATDRLWPGSLAPCPTTQKLVRAMTSRWTPPRHHLYHPAYRRHIHAVLLVSIRLSRRPGPLTTLPAELWLVLCGFLRRSDWPTANVTWA